MHAASMPRILGVGTALPPHYADQQAITAALREAWGRQHYNVKRLDQLHRAVQVQGRYLALPLADYPALQSFQQRNDAWIAASLEVGERAIVCALEASGLTRQHIDHLLVVTTTGIATPSLDARLVNRMRLREDILRTPIFGLGCAGGAGGLVRAADYVRAYPDRIAMLLSTEICSLTIQREDLSIPNIIASGLFGDGAAAVVVGCSGAVGGEIDDTGATRSGLLPPVIEASASVFYPDTERVMGWDLVDSGFKLALSAQVPNVVRTHVRQDVECFLGRQGLDLAAIDHWIAHTGGPRVLEAMAEALELPETALERSWRSLAEIGNLSSASVLFVLEDLVSSGSVRPGDRGLLLAMGPGFACEMLLLRW